MPSCLPIPESRQKQNSVIEGYFAKAISCPAVKY